MSNVAGNIKWGLFVVLVLGVVVGGLTLIGSHDEHVQEAEWNALSPDARTIAATLENRMYTAERGDLIVMKDGKIYFLTERLEGSDESKAVRCVGCIDVLLGPMNVAPLMSKMVKPTDPEYSTVLVEFATQTPR